MENQVLKLTLKAKQKLLASDSLTIEMPNSTRLGIEYMEPDDATAFQIYVHRLVNSDVHVFGRLFLSDDSQIVEAVDSEGNPLSTEQIYEMLAPIEA